jgi:hypothetical protein
MKKLIKNGEDLEHNKDQDHGVEGLQPYIGIRQ